MTDTKAPRRPRKLTRVLLWTALFCLVGNVVCTLLAEREGWKYWQPMYLEDSALVYAYQNEVDRCDVLIVGSSRAQRGLRSEVIEQELRDLGAGDLSVFNVSQRGGSIFTASVVLRDALARGPRPRLVLVGVGVTSLNSNTGIMANGLKYYASPGEILERLPETRSFDAVGASLFGLFRGVFACASVVYQGPGRPEQRDRLREIVAAGGRPHTRDGREPLGSLSAEDRKRIVMRTTKRFRERRLRDYRIEGLADRSMRRILDLSGSSGVPVVLIGMPATEAYWSIPTEDQLATYHDYLREIESEGRTEFVDLDDGRLTEMDFVDLHHLTIEGATKVSRRLAREVILPRLGTSDPDRR